MKKKEILEKAFAMPLTHPSYTKAPYRFYKREYFIITYRTDPDALRKVVPEPLAIEQAYVKYEFMRMPDSSFGSFAESGQLIPIIYEGKKGGYIHSMYLNNEAPISGGREIWGFPKKYAEPKLEVEKDTLVGSLDYGSVRVATGTMGYKYEEVNPNKVLESLKEPQYLLKILPDVDGTCKICQLVRYFLEDITLYGAWSGPCSLELHPHALAPVSQLPVLEIISSLHFVADVTLGLGEVVVDYLKKG